MDPQRPRAQPCPPPHPSTTPAGPIEDHPAREKLSIASLFATICGGLGLVSCTGLLLGPMAIVLGVVGLAKTRERVKPRRSGRGLAITGLVLGVVSLPVSALGLLQLGIMIPAVSSARETASRAKSEIIQKSIVLGFRRSASLDPAFARLDADAALASAIADAHIAPDWEQVYASPVRGTPLLYVVPGHVTDPTLIVTYDNPANWDGKGGIVAFGDGTTEWFDEPEFSSRIDGMRMSDGAPPPHLRPGRAVPDE